MPLYGFNCWRCGHETEASFKIIERPDQIYCEICGEAATRVISSRIERTEPTWLDDAKRQLHEDSRDQIRDRNDLYRYMKREGINQIG